MEPSICFVCLSSAHKSFHDKHDSSLYSRFCKVSQLYLGISSSLTNYDKGKSSEVAKFCDNCELVVSSICQLHQELVAVQLRLSSKLGELGELLENSQLEETEWISCHSSSTVITSLSKQLGVKNPVVVDSFRSYLKKKCERERSKSLPVVVAKRLGSGPPSTGSSEERQKASEVVEPACNGRPFSCAPVEIVGTSYLIKTEPLDEAILSKFVDEGEDDEDNSCFEATPKCEQASLAVYHLPTTENKSLRCTQCRATFTTIYNLRQHVEAVHNPQSHVCSRCQKVFSAAIYLRKHTLRVHPHLPEFGKRHRCPKCDKPFLKRFNWKRHVSACAAPQNPMKLKLEPDSSNLVDSWEVEPLEEESTTSKDKKGTKFGCPICGKGYSTRSTVVDHVRRAHSKKRYSCQKCPASFTCKQNLEGHLANVHNPKPHVCSYCKKVFPSKGYLQRHVHRKHPH